MLCLAIVVAEKHPRELRRCNSVRTKTLVRRARELLNCTRVTWPNLDEVLRAVKRGALVVGMNQSLNFKPTLFIDSRAGLPPLPINVMKLDRL